MIGLVHKAKKQLLKEKIKKKLDKKMGAELNKLADLLVNTVFDAHKRGGLTKEDIAGLETALKDHCAAKKDKE